MSLLVATEVGPDADDSAASSRDNAVPSVFHVGLAGSSPGGPEVAYVRIRLGPLPRNAARQRNALLGAEKEREESERPVSPRVRDGRGVFPAPHDVLGGGGERPERSCEVLPSSSSSPSTVGRRE